MNGRRRIPGWVRVGLLAGVVGSLVACGTLVAFQLSRPAPRLFLPNGLDGAMILLPAVLAVGMFAVCCPMFMAATRSEAVLGALAAVLVSADVLMGVSLGFRDAILVHPLDRSVPLGLVAAALALPVAVVSTLAGQLTSPFGFGRSAGLRSAVGGSIAGVVAVALAAWAI
jgi:hypothetical protein